MKAKELTPAQKRKQTLEFNRADKRADEIYIKVCAALNVFSEIGFDLDKVVNPRKLAEYLANLK